MKQVLLAILLFLGCGVAQGNTYYIAQSGLDSNNGTSKTTPWLHAPGMTGATGTPASYSCTAGDTFILKGGDTWAAGNFPWNWTCSGTSGSHITITVDQTWYDGASWSRPVMNGSGTYPGSLAGGGVNKCFLNAGGTYIDESWLEWTGMYWTGAPNTSACYIEAGFSNNTFNYNYMHGWTHAAYPTTDDAGVGFYGSISGAANGTSFSYNVCDGSDTAENSFGCAYGGGTWAYNVFNEYVSVQVDGTVSVHDNLFENALNSFGSAHPNTMEDDGSCNAVFYNNVVRNTASGSEPFYIGPHTSCTAYVFNNILSQIGSPNMITFGSDATGSAHSTVHYAWNNTIEGGLDSDPPAYNCYNVSSSTYVSAVTIKNTACASSLGVNNAPAGVTITTASNNLKTLAAWNALGYTSTQPYAFSPTSGSSPTIGVGASLASLCSTVSGINSAAGTACGLGTTYAVIYNTSNHTVTSPAVTPSTRSTWDQGAYQGVPGSAVPPVVPPPPPPVLLNTSASWTGYSPLPTVTVVTPEAGNWIGAYGKDGYWLAQSVESLPSYATASISGDSVWTWETSASDAIDLEVPGGSARLAACWYAPATFSFNVNFTDGNTHQLTLYVLDFDQRGRTETIQIVNAATGAVLVTQQLANFTSGLYPTFQISGNVKINVTCTAGVNAVVSGLFFGA